MKNRYRIRQDWHKYYHPEVKFWWFPIFWWDLSFDGFEKKSLAEKYILDHQKPRAIEYL